VSAETNTRTQLAVSQILNTQPDPQTHRYGFAHRGTERPERCTNKW